MGSKKTEERLNKLESAFEAILQRLDAVEKKIEPVDNLRKRVDDTDSKQAIHELSVEDKIKDIGIETDSKVVTSELRSEEKIKDLGEKFKETVDKVVAIELRVSELSNEWPTPSEGWSQVKNKRSKERKLSQSSSRTSFAEKYKDKPSDTIVLVGDSLARGVGARLEQQSNMVSTISVSGGHIEDITKELCKLGDKDDRHIVVLVGTNNIKGEGSEVVLSKYKCLIDESNKIKNRKVSIVGIPRRLDLSTVHNSRRIGVNKRLKELCEAMNVEFIDYEPLDNRLARDGLHLNHLGQDDLGRKIFKHCKRFLM